MAINLFEDYSMTWKPDIINSNKPIYITIADQLENDIKTGILSPGTKLPPQRELANFLDVNLSTISRAFKLCSQKGLICATIGNGTFVSSDVAANNFLLPDFNSSDIIDMGAMFPESESSDEIVVQMKKMINKREGTFICVKSTALNPAVLGVTELNDAAVIFPKIVLCSNNVLLYSEINKKTKPLINKISVV